MFLCSNPLASFITSIRDMSTNYKKIFMDSVKLQELSILNLDRFDISWLHQLQVWYLITPMTTKWKHNISSSVYGWYYYHRQWSLGDSRISKTIGWSILPQRSRTLELLFESGSNIYILRSPHIIKKVYSRLIIKEKYAGCKRGCNSPLY